MGKSLGVLFPSSQTKAEIKVSSFLLSMEKNQEISITEISRSLGLSPSSTRKFLDWICKHQDMPKIVVVNGVTKRLD